jgi:hypothetical protein
VGLSAFEQLDNRLKHTDDSAERTVVILGESSQAVEVPEQLVSAVEQVNGLQIGAVDTAIQHHRRFLVE